MLSTIITWMMMRCTDDPYIDLFVYQWYLFPVQTSLHFDVFTWKRPRKFRPECVCFCVFCLNWVIVSWIDRSMIVWLVHVCPASFWLYVLVCDYSRMFYVTVRYLCFCYLITGGLSPFPPSTTLSRLTQTQLDYLSDI